MPNTRFSSLSRIYLIVLGLIAVTAIALLAAPSSSRAADQPFKIAFDQDQVKIGLIGDLPVDATAAGGSVEGTVDDDGNVTIPAEGFKFPIYGISDPVNLQAYMSTSAPMTGTWDEATGQLVLNGKVGIFLKINIGETLDALSGLGIDLGGSLGPLAVLLNGDIACGFSPMDVTFSTENPGGARFSRGALGPGAVAAEWAQLGKFSGQSGVGLSSLACPLIKSYAPTLLDGLLGGSGIDLGGLGLGDLDLASLLDNLDNLNLGPSSLTLTRSIDENPDPEPPVASPELKLSVSPKQRKLKSGKKTSVAVKVRNSGDGAASGVTVCLTPSGPVSIQGKRCRKVGKMTAGAIRTRSFSLKAKKLRNRQRHTARVGVQVKASNTSASRTSVRVQIRR